MVIPRKYRLLIFVAVCAWYFGLPITAAVVGYHRSGEKGATVASLLTVVVTVLIGTTIALVLGAVLARRSSEPSDRQLP